MGFAFFRESKTCLSFCCAIGWDPEPGEQMSVATTEAMKKYILLSLQSSPYIELGGTLADLELKTLQIQPRVL